jgi:hypothetical protein
MSKTGPTPGPAVTKSNNTQSQKKGQMLVKETEESDTPMPPQLPATTTQLPKKRGRKPKVATSHGDADTEPPTKKAKTSIVKALPPNRDALPAHGVRNDYPARKAKVIPSTRRTSKQVAADHEAVRKAAEVEVERKGAAVRFLAEMQVDEEMFDEDMEIDNPHHLAEVRVQNRVESGDEGGESFESISSGLDSDSDNEDEPSKAIVSDSILLISFFYSPH